MNKDPYELSEKSKSEFTSIDLPINYLKSPPLSKVDSNKQSTQLTQNIYMNCSLNSQNEKERSN